MQQEHQILVADIGGTNGRFALASHHQGEHHQGQIELHYQQTIPSQGAKDLIDLVQQYLAHLPQGIELSGASLAMAGPVTNAGGYLTNLGWQVDREQLKQALKVPSVCLLNDFAAYANSIPLLPAHELAQLKAGKKQLDAPILVLGPGTGFGVASLQPQRLGGHQPIACEGGHIHLAPANARQIQVLQQLMTEFDHVSVETVLCGPGLVNLYRALCAIEQQTPQFSQAAEISAAGQAKTDPLAHETLHLFCQWLGQVVGDLVMAHGAKGGVVLGGGILPRMVDFVRQSEFLTGFSNKGAMSHYLSDILVNIAMKSDTALMGAAAWWLQYHGCNRS